MLCCMLRVTDIKNNYSNCLVNEAVYLDAACQWFCVNVAEVVVCIQQQQQQPLLLLLLVHPFNGLFSTTTWVSRYHKGKTSLDLNEARDDGVLGCSGISWTICKQSAPRSRQITSPTPHRAIFAGQVLFLTADKN